MFKRLSLSMLSGVLAFSMFSVTAAADSHDYDENDAWVRIVHASPDAPAVDVTVNGDVVVEGADFKDATDYLELPAGEHEVAIYPAGEHDEPVYETYLEVSAGGAYTVAAIDTLENLDLYVIEDETSATEGMAWVRVGHLSPDAPAVDVTAGGDILFEGAEFPGVTGYEEVEPGTYDLDVRVSGTEDVVLDLSGTELSGDMLYTVLAVGFADGEPGLDTIILADESHEMPSEMPATGMGGTADQNGYTAGMIIVLLLASGAMGFVLLRKPVLENQ
ncbi:DUF4397 domain-containing protein [Alteribacter natronophilus]|uniref:DUF4397 domain-containing protein n=1 Tax=Alteribacter natronophilus TaxID=2583810 RepID=UPI001FE59E29|nr:DUF4397 domain-containing protein [Alteribacter natronophilus]